MAFCREPMEIIGRPGLHRGTAEGAHRPLPQIPWATLNLVVQKFGVQLDFLKGVISEAQILRAEKKELTGKKIKLQRVQMWLTLGSQSHWVCSDRPPHFQED